MPYKDIEKARACRRECVKRWRKQNKDLVRAQRKRRYERELKKLGKKPRSHEKHGATGTPEMIAYRNAKQRCTNPNREGYPRYGGRGIEFRFTSFAQFMAALGPRPEGKTLDRWPDPDGHYEPGNVRWATMRENQQNKSYADRQWSGEVSLVAV